MSTLYEKNMDDKIAKYGQNLHKKQMHTKCTKMTYLQTIGLKKIAIYG